MILQIKRGNRVIAESADFSYSPSLQEVRKLTCEVVSVVPIEFKAYNSKSESEYDTVVYNGNTFILYQAPSGDNLNEAGKYKYSLLFYGKEVLLQNVAFLDIVSGTGGEINKIRYTHGGLFQFWGDAKQLAARIEANIESYNASLGAGYTGIGTWTLNVDAEGELTEDMIDITDGTNLFEALKNFYDKFYLNYYFSTTANGGIITITDKTRPSVNWTFKQGDGGGAVKVSSSIDTSTPVITRIIPQGGSRNVPPEYKKDAKPADESRYCPYILLPNDSAGNIRYYIDSEYGLKNYGVRGKTISNTFSGIYPSIRGKKLGDLYPSGLPEWDTYKADGEPDPQSGKVAGEGASAATRIDKIIGSTPIKSDDSDSFFIYMTSPGFNLGYKVYEDGDSSDKINDNVQPQYKPHAMFDKYRDFESFDIYSTRAYYDQPVKITASFSGKMLFSILPIGSDAVGKKVKINLRMVTNRVLGQASPLKEVVIGEEGATGMLEIPYDKTALVGYIEKGQNTTVTIRVEFTFDSDVPVGSCKIGFSEEMTCNIHFGNQDGSQDRFYYKYASVTDAVFSMRTGTYTGTEFKINKNGIIPLYGEVNGDTGETEEDVAMFNKGARYKISCYRTDSDNAKLPLYTDGKSPSIAAGTEFVILNIVMPESYVTMAENTLEKAALDYLSRYDHENRTVSLDISSGFVAEHPNLFIDFIEGNMLKVRDDGIGVFDFSDNGQIVDMKLQIQSLEIKYSKENMFPSYSCTIARRKILSFYERLAQENQTASTQNTTNVTLGGSGTGSGTNIFSEQLLNDLIASFQKFNGWFEWDEVNQALRCKSAFYTNQWISALGAQSGSGEPGGGEGGLIKAVYGFADLGKTFDDSNLSNTFNAYTINEIWKLAKEGGMNTDKLWQELGKDDPTKKIHISHLPDNKFVTIDTEQTVTASKIFTGQLSTANVVPSVNNASTLGLESKRWENIYAVDANISGTVKTQALQVGDIKIIYDSVNKAVTFEHIDGSTEIGFYTRGWISALGVSPGGSGGSGGDGLVKNVYGFSNLGTTFSDSDLDNTFNAYTINEIWKMAKEGGGIKNITKSGSGNAVTDMTLSSDGKTITAVFGETFARQQDLGTLNNTVTQLSNKLNNFLEGSDADNIINKWKELEAFLDGLTESDNLAELLALKADKTITISAGTGLTGGGNLSANRTLSLATTGVKAGTYTKVTVDTYGRVTVGDNPTTLAGYGITDAVTLTTAQTISGRKTFSQNIVFNNNGGITYPDGNVALRNSDGHTILASFGDGSINLRPNGHNNTEGAVLINKAGNVQAPSVSTNTITIGDAQLVYDSANKALRVKHRTDGNTVGFYSDGWVSALGVKTGGSGGGSGVIKTVYSFANLTDGTTFSDSDLDNTFNAYTINEIWKMAKEGGGIKNITKSGSGNAVTDMTLSSDGKTITAVFGETFARQQDLGTLNNTVTQLSNKLNNFLEGSDADNIINKWKELEAFLDGLTESDNLAELLALKADKTITISAGTGLTGGGNLSANRTLSLATTGVKAGTYTKVTVDTYGRVTVGDNPTTLAGYGITDAVTLTTAQTISGRKTFSQNIVFNNNGGITYPDGNVALRNSDGHTILASFGDGSINLRPNGHNNTEGAVLINKAGNVQAPSVSTNTITIGDAQLVYDSANKALRVKHRTDGNTVGFYSDGWVSALGVKTGGSGGGSGVIKTVYSFANLTDGTTFSDSDLDNTFNAYTIKKLYDMAGQGGLDADAMWAELKKADSSKIIDESHIPTSVLDGRWVKKTGDTMTGTLTSASTSGAIVFKGLENCDITNFYTMNGTLDSNSRLAIRNGLRFNWYDTYWYIGNIRGESADSNGFGIANESHKLCLQVTPNNTIAPVFRSTVATGLSPLIVSSNTTVDNLSADLLDGYHAFGTSNALIKYGYTVGGTEPAWCRIATYSIRDTETMTDVCFVLHSAFSDLFGLLVVKTRGTAVVEGLLIAAYNINRSNIRIYHDAEKKNIELYCYGGSRYSIIQANLLYSHNRNGGANTNITLYRADTKAPSWSTYVNPVFAPLLNSSEAAKKLQTPRTLWGQSFDGTANVSGNMTGVGSINMSGQLTSTVASGTAPFIVVSNTVVGNLNADLLDGFHAERFLLSVGRSDGTFDLNTYSERAIKEIRTAEQTTNNAPFAGYGLLANLWDSNKFAALQIGGTSTDLFFRGKHDGTNKITSAWHRLLHTENYASIADGRYVKKAGDTMTGDLTMGGGHMIYLAQASATSTQHIRLQGGSNDYGRIAFGATAENAGWMEIASCDDGNEPIYVRQYAGVFTSIKRTATLLDASGNTSFPGSVTSVRHISTVGTGTQPYQCSSTTLNINLNADMLDSWHINFLPRNYINARTYSVQFALGDTDNNWKKIFACSESGAEPYRSVTVWGQIWYAYGNHAQEEVRYYHFCAIFYMRSGPSSSNSSVGNVENSARLYLPTFAKGMDNIRLVRVGKNNFEIQVRQIGSWHNGHIQYQYWANGANVSAWENLQSTSNTSVAVSAGGASTLADSRASSADVLTISRTLWGRPFNGSANIDGNIDNAAVITSKGGIWLDLKGSSGVAFYSGGSLCAVINNTGVGIGTSSPSQKLHVAGNIIATGAITAKASSSDIRLKTDIQGYDAMGIIRKFRSVKYHWNAIAKENSEVFNHNNWNYGLIAQDLLSGGYSQWVKDAFNDYYTIDYERLIPVVWKGLQEVDDEVTRLKKRVRELEKRLGINN
jgi:phage-related tail fiber protein